MVWNKSLGPFSQHGRIEIKPCLTNKEVSDHHGGEIDESVSFEAFSKQPVGAIPPF